MHGSHDSYSRPTTALVSPTRLPRRGPLILLGLLATPSSACKEPSTPADVDIHITATGGLGQASTGDGDDGLDETGDGPTAVEDDCLFDEKHNRYGYKYQCVGQFTVEILVNDLDPEFLMVDFGQAGSPDSYEQPHVMACCPLSDSQPCDDPHLQACVIDMVEQGCKSLVPRLEELAKDRPLLSGPLLKTAEWIARASSQEACLQTFLFDTAIGTTEPSCDENDNSVFDFDGALDGTTWSFNPDNTSAIDHVELTIVSPEVWDAEAPTDPPQTCTSSNENDLLSFLEIDPTAGEVKATLLEGSLTLTGPAVDGIPVGAQASLSSIATTCATPYCSRAAWSAGTSEGELHAMSLFSQQPTELAISSGSLTVDSFQLHLFTPAQGVASGDIVTIAAGEALFVVSAEALGEDRWITAWNATPIQLHGTAESRSIDGFTIDYQDAAGDIWEVTLPSSTWQ